MKHATLLLCVLLAPVSAAHALSAAEVLKEVDAVRAPADSFTFDLEVEFRRRDDISTAGFKVRVKDTRKSLVLYHSPPTSRGRALLMVEQNMWIYIPGTRRAIRISPQQQLLGRVSNADVARVVYNLDYTPMGLTEDSVDGERAHRLSLTASGPGAAYQSISLWASSKDYRPIKAEFYAVSGRLIKSVSYKGYEEVLGRARPMVLEIVDGTRKDELTVMRYSDMKVEDTPDVYFQKGYLPRLR